MLGLITRSRRDQAGFINPEAFILGTILLFIAAILIPVASRFQSRWILVVGAVLLGLAVVSFAIDLFQFRRHRKRADGEK